MTTRRRSPARRPRREQASSARTARRPPAPGMITGMTAPAPQITVVPANRATWEDLQAVFGRRGSTSRCQCQRYKLPSKDFFESIGIEARAGDLREQTDCGASPVGHHQRPGRLPRRGAGGVVRGRAADRVPAAGQHRAGAVGGPRRGPVGQQRVGGDLPRHPGRLPAARCQPRPGPGGCRPRPRARGPRPGGVPDDHAQRHRRGDARRHRAHLRRSRPHGGQPTDEAPGGDADRLPGRRSAARRRDG